MSRSPFHGVRTLLSSAAIFALLTTSASCGGWNVESSIYLPKYRAVWKGLNEQAAYRVGEPGPTWDALEDRRKRDVQVAWFSEDLGSIINVRVQCQEHGDSDLESFTDHLRIDFTDWQILEEPSGELDEHGEPRMRPMQRHTRLANRDALRTRVDAKLDGQPVMLELLVGKKDGCLIDLQLIAPQQNFAKGLAAYERVVDGFEFPLDRR